MLPTGLSLDLDFDILQYWERKQLENAVVGRRLRDSVSMGEWVLGVRCISFQEKLEANSPPKVENCLDADFSVRSIWSTVSHGDGGPTLKSACIFAGSHGHQHGRVCGVRGTRRG